jgi:hypothetical protein
MPLLRTFRSLVIIGAIAAFVVGAMSVGASPASLTAKATYVQDSGLSVTVNWNTGSDNGSPQVWVCDSYNGATPLPFDFGASGSQKANFVRNGTYLIGLYTDSDCTALFQNQSVTVSNG